MGNKGKDDEPKERINQFIIECLFNKYFEEKKEIASPPPSVADRNDERVALPVSSE